MFALLAFLLLLLAPPVQAQDSNAAPQDSSAAPVDNDTTGAGGVVRPRRETYLIHPFPSPARAGDNIQIQYYNHNPEELSVDIIDLLNRVVFVVQPRALTPNGVHRVQLPAGRLSSASYFIRLRTYSATGTQLSVETLRLVIAR